MVDTDTSAVPQRSIAARRATPVFYSEFNDIDVFVEDSARGYKKIYIELLKRVFADARIAQVFPIGERQSVIEACRDAQTMSLSRKRLYITDGDLYLLHSPIVPVLTGLFVLPRYCIENLLIDEDAITQAFYEKHPDDEYNEVKRNLDFNSWLIANEQELYNLFVEYAVANKLAPHLQTVKYPVNKLRSSNTGVVDDAKVQRRINELKNEVISFCGEEVYEATKSQIISNSYTEPLKMLKYVSGKDYLLPMIYLRACTLCSIGYDTMHFKLRLAMLASVTPILDMKLNLLG